MNAARLIEAIEAAVDYAADEEPGVVIVAARSACLAGRWFIAEGRRKSFRRVYVVDLADSPAARVVEVMGGSRMNDEALILTARRAIEGGRRRGRGDLIDPPIPAI